MPELTAVQIAKRAVLKVQAGYTEFEQQLVDCIPGDASDAGYGPHRVSVN